MGEQKVPAEIWIEQQDVTFYGVVVSSDPQTVKVRIEDTEADLALLAPGASADLTVIANGAVCLSVTDIASMEGDTLTLRYRHAARRIQRRGSFRRSCSLRATYRVLDDEAAEETWHPTTVEDIGIGGCCLILAHEGHVPDAMEVLVALPDRSSSESAARRADTDENKMRLVGRITNIRLGDGRERLVGIAFAGVSIEDKFRLARFSGEARMEDVA